MYGPHNPSQQYAIKRFNKLTLRKNKQYIRKPSGHGMMIWTQLDAVYREIEVMRQVQHENCVQLYEVIEDKYEEDEEGEDD